jgi:hypothetical protein
VDLLEDRLRQQLEHLSSQASDGACVGRLVTQGEVVGKEQALLLSSRKKVEVGWRTRWGTHTGYLVEPAAVWKVQRPARLLDQRDPFLSPRSSSDSSTGSNHRSSTSRSASYLIRETQIAGDVLDVCRAGDFVGGGVPGHEDRRGRLPTSAGAPSITGLSTLTGRVAESEIGS